MALPVLGTPRHYRVGWTSAQGQHMVQIPSMVRFTSSEITGVPPGSCSQYRFISHWQNQARSEDLAFKTPLDNILSYSYLINKAAVPELLHIIIHMNETIHYTYT